MVYVLAASLLILMFLGIVVTSYKGATATSALPWWNIAAAALLVILCLVAALLAQPPQTFASVHSISDALGFVSIYVLILGLPYLFPVSMPNGRSLALCFAVIGSIIVYRVAPEVRQHDIVSLIIGTLTRILTLVLKATGAHWSTILAFHAVGLLALPVAWSTFDKMRDALGFCCPICC